MLHTKELVIGCVYIWGTYRIPLRAFVPYEFCGVVGKRYRFRSYAGVREFSARTISREFHLNAETYKRERWEHRKDAKEAFAFARKFAGYAPQESESESS